jgi:hypothetical protein
MWDSEDEMNEIMKEFKQGVKIAAKMLELMSEDDELIDSIVNVTLKFRQKLIDKGINPDVASTMAVGMSGAIKK